MIHRERQLGERKKVGIAMWEGCCGEGDGSTSRMISAPSRGHGNRRKKGIKLNFLNGRENIKGRSINFEFLGRMACVGSLGLFVILGKVGAVVGGILSKPRKNTNHMNKA